MLFYWMYVVLFYICFVFNKYIDFNPFDYCYLLFIHFRWIIVFFFPKVNLSYSSWNGLNIIIAAIEEIDYKTIVGIVRA